MCQKQRRPHELLGRIEAIAIEEAKDCINEPVWRLAAAFVSGMVSMKLELLPNPLYKRRSYYGPKGSLSNPFR